MSNPECQLLFTRKLHRGPLTCQVAKAVRQMWSKKYNNALWNSGEEVWTNLKWKYSSKIETPQHCSYRDGSNFLKWPCVRFLSIIRWIYRRWQWNPAVVSEVIPLWWGDASRRTAWKCLFFLISCLESASQMCVWLCVADSYWIWLNFLQLCHCDLNVLLERMTLMPPSPAPLSPFDKTATKLAGLPTLQVPNNILSGYKRTGSSWCVDGCV